MRRILLLKFVAICVLTAISSSYVQVSAQTPTSSSAAIATDQLLEQRGTAIELALQSNGIAFAIDPAYQTWRKLPGEKTSWQRIPGIFQKIYAGMDDSVWALNNSGEVFRWVNELWWQKQNTEATTDIAAAPDGTVYLLLKTGRLLSFLNNAAAEINWPAEMGQARGIASDEHGLLWAWSEEGRLYRHDGVSWHFMLTDTQIRISRLFVGPKGSVLLLSTSGAVHAWQHESKSWQALSLPFPVKTLGLGPGDAPWFVDPSGRISAVKQFQALKEQATEAKPALFTKLLTWQKVRGVSLGLSISPDGTVYSLDRDLGIWRWHHKDQWTSLMGKLRVVVAAASELWGIGIDQRVVKLQTGYWTPVGNLQAKSLASSAKGEVFALSMNDELLLWNVKSGRWLVQFMPTDSTFSSSTGLRGLAVDPKGNPWLVAADGAVWRKTELGWKAIPGKDAQSLSIGPEGTAYVATIASDLMWLDERENIWKPATGQAATVAVGPAGMPWRVSNSSELFASKLFLEQSEQKTQQKIADKPPTGLPVFVLPPPAAVMSLPKTVTVASFEGSFVDVSAASQTVFVVKSDGELACFNPAQKTFSAINAGLIRKVSVDRGGQPWLVTGNGDVLRWASSRWQLIENFKASDIESTADGRIFAIAANSNIVHRWNNDSFVPFHLADTTALIAKKFSGFGAASLSISPNGLLQQCNGNRCAMPSHPAQDIAFGMDGSRWSISPLDGIKIFDGKTQSWITPHFGSIQGSHLSISPNGSPWLINTSGRLVAVMPVASDNRQRPEIDCAKAYLASPVLSPANASILTARDDIVTLAPGSTYLILNNDTQSGRAVSLDQVNFQVIAKSPDLQFTSGLLSLSSRAIIGSVHTATYSICTSTGQSACSTAQVRVSVQNLIVATADRFNAIYSTNGNTFDLLRNDTLLGLPLSSANVTAINPNPRDLSVSSAGIVTVANNARGPQNYTLTYTVCAMPGSTPCASTQSFIATPTPLINARHVGATYASNSSFSLYEGVTYGAGAGNANNVSITTNVNPAFTQPTYSGCFMLNQDSTTTQSGYIRMQACAAPTPYTITGTYRACNVSDLSQCVNGTWAYTNSASAQLATLNANNDVATLPAGSTLSILNNDFLNGSVPTTSSVTVQFTTLSPALSYSNGVVSVSSNAIDGSTLAASYVMCTSSGLQVCSTANVSITVREQFAVVSESINASYAVGGSPYNLLANDSYRGTALLSASVSAINASPLDLSISSAGVLTVANNAVGPSNYSVDYTACVLPSSSPCATTRSFVTTPVPMMSTSLISVSYVANNSINLYSGVAYGSGAGDSHNVVITATADAPWNVLPFAACYTLNQNGATPQAGYIRMQSCPEPPPYTITGTYQACNIANLAQCVTGVWRYTNNN